MQPKNLFLIDGAAGTGKSDLLEFVKKQIVGKRASTLEKYSTRKLRDEERRTSKCLDLKFVSDAEFSSFVKKGDFYHYTYPHRVGARYGFYRSDLEAKLKEFDNVFLIVRSATTIQDIAADFPDVNVVPIFVYTMETTIADRLKKEGYTQEEIDFRLSRSSEAVDDLYTHPTLYKYVIINNSDRGRYQKQLKDRFDELTKPQPNVLRISAREYYQLPAVLIPHKDKMVTMLRQYQYNKNVFVMMRYREDVQDTYNLIHMVIENAGYNCVRADLPEWSITNDDIYNPFAVLYCCKYGIALFDAPEEDYTYSPNVAVELAYMHLQDKRCLMLKHRDLPTPPFDLMSKIYQEYNREVELVEIIRRWLTRL
ncbi:MAG: hypothetical protein JW779_00910 [Candidatus Thorarchaeota archaeon]|nr:hypothetical protein [Candidatus Thorarchaeota archaeon]